MSLVATLIANPQAKNLTETIVSTAAQLAGADTIDWLAPAIACDLHVSQDADGEELQQILSEQIGQNEIDVAVQATGSRRKKALIADMDSTMIDQECIDELAAEVGIKEKVAAITAKAMNGEIDFEDAINERVALLQGLNTSVIGDIIDKRITLASGGRTLVGTMKANGCYCALVSGGFTSFTEVIAKKLGFDENRANVLEVENGLVKGTVQKPVLGAQAKVEALNDIASNKGLCADDFVAVGDGANDLPMLQLAGTGVALHAKRSVAAQSKIRIDYGDLTSLLYLQGYHDHDFVNG